MYLITDSPFHLERGKGLWKLNTSLLKDASFYAEIARFWAEWRPEQGRFRTLSAWWDAGKVRLRQLIRLFSWELSSAEKERIGQLSGTIEALQQQSDRGQSSLADLEYAKAALSTELEAVARGAQIRAQVQWAEDCERSSRYFFATGEIARSATSYCSHPLLVWDHRAFDSGYLGSLARLLLRPFFCTAFHFSPPGFFH